VSVAPASWYVRDCALRRETFAKWNEADAEQSAVAGAAL
jgi:hypothetical protein